MPDCPRDMARLQDQAGKTARRPLRFDAARFVKGSPMGKMTSSEVPRISPDDIALLGSNAIRSSAATSQEINRRRSASTTVDREQKSANNAIHRTPTRWHSGCLRTPTASGPVPVIADVRQTEYEPTSLTDTAGIHWIGCALFAVSKTAWYRVLRSRKIYLEGGDMRPY